MNQDGLIPFFFFIHPQEPTAGLGFRFPSVLNLQLSQGQQHIGQQPRPAGQALLWSLDTQWQGGRWLCSQSAVQGGSGEVNSTAAERAGPWGKRDELTWPCTRGRWLLTAGECHMPGVLLIAFRIALSPSPWAGHPSNKQDHQEKWGLTWTNLQERDTANDSKGTLHGKWLITLYVN